MDLSNYKGRKQVNIKEYDKFIHWYMKKNNIRVLKTKDMVDVRYVKDKKTKETVAETITRHGNIVYLIYDKFYQEYQDTKDDISTDKKLVNKISSIISLNEYHQDKINNKETILIQDVIADIEFILSLYNGWNNAFSDSLHSDNKNEVREAKKEIKQLNKLLEELKIY